MLSCLLYFRNFRFRSTPICLRSLQNDVSQLGVSPDPSHERNNNRALDKQWPRMKTNSPSWLPWRWAIKPVIYASPGPQLENKSPRLTNPRPSPPHTVPGPAPHGTVDTALPAWLVPGQITTKHGSPWSPSSQLYAVCARAVIDTQTQRIVATTPTQYLHRLRTCDVSERRVTWLFT